MALSYGAADQLTQITYDGRTETRTYNSRFQLTRLTVPGSMDLEYRYFERTLVGSRQEICFRQALDADPDSAVISAYDRY